MTMLRNALVITSFTVLMTSSLASAGVKLSVVGVGALGMPSSSGVTFSDGTSPIAYPTPTGKLGVGGGLLLEFMMGSHLGLELGAQYYQRKIDMDFTSFGGGATSFVFPTVEVPVTLNIHVNRVIALNLGGYITAPGGAGTATAASGSSDVSNSDLLLRNMNYGLIAGLGLNIPMGTTVGLRLEARYHMALQNQFDDNTIAVQSGASWKQNELQILAGFSFGGMSMK